MGGTGVIVIITSYPGKCYGILHTSNQTFSAGRVAFARPLWTIFVVAGGVGVVGRRVCPVTGPPAWEQRFNGVVSE